MISTASQATVTLHLYSSAGLPNNLANGSVAITNGMQWGVIVDSAGDGFAGGGTSYTAYTPGSGTAGKLQFNGVDTDDYYIPGTFTVNAGVLINADGGTTPGSGSIVDDVIVDFGLTTTGTNTISATDKFALVWFGSAGNTATAGSKYGFFADNSFVIGSDGGDPEFGAIFAGNDTTRAASNTFQSVGASPEPSRVLLVVVGALGMVVRRRRRA